MTEESQFLLTDHELLAMFAMNPGEAATATRHLFRLSNVEHQQVLERAGVTSLLARGLAEAQGEDIVPVDRGALVAAILTTATGWLEIELNTPLTDHVMYVAAAEDGMILFSLSRLRVHEVRLIDPSQNLAELGVLLAQTYLSEAIDGLPASAMIKLHPALGESRSAKLIRDESDSWDLLFGQGDDAVPVTVTAADAFQRMQDALAP